jgi:uridine kinase
MKPKFIAIAGGSGAGKTTFAKYLRSFLSDNSPILALDNYYKKKELQIKDRNGIENFDIPEAFDLSKLQDDLTKLSKGKSIMVQKYNYNQSNHPIYKYELIPNEFVIVEGLYALYFEAILELSLFNIFIISDLKSAYLRRLKRDEIERGYGIDDVTYRFYQHAVDSYLNIIYHTKIYADYEVINTGDINNLINQAKEVSLLIKEKLQSKSDKPSSNLY